MDKFCLNQKYYKGSKSVSGDLKNQYGHDQAFLSKTTRKTKDPLHFRLFHFYLTLSIRCSGHPITAIRPFPLKEKTKITRKAKTV